MNNAIDCYDVLTHSPLILAPLLESFYSTAIVQQRNVLLSYIVLPLSLHPSTRGFLAKSRATSNLRTFSNDPTRLYGLAERITEFRRLTDRCMQIAFDAKSLSLQHDLSVKYLAKRLDSAGCPANAYAAARKLGTLLHVLDIPTVYRFLGVKRL
jgi:hypothetical protein